jgi:hypothetical protein
MQSKTQISTQLRRELEDSLRPRHLKVLVVEMELIAEFG